VVMPAQRRILTESFSIFGDFSVRNEVLLAISAMVSVGVADVLRRRGLISGGSPVTCMTIETGFMAFFSFIAVFLLEGRLNLNRDIAVFSPVTGFLIFAGILALLIAVSTSEASQYAPITRLSFVSTFLLAIFVFGDFDYFEGGWGGSGCRSDSSVVTRLLTTERAEFILCSHSTRYRFGGLPRNP